MNSEQDAACRQEIRPHRTSQLTCVRGVSTAGFHRAGDGSRCQPRAAGDSWCNGVCWVKSLGCFAAETGESGFVSESSRGSSKVHERDIQSEAGRLKWLGKSGRLRKPALDAPPTGGIGWGTTQSLFWKLITGPAELRQ